MRTVVLLVFALAAPAAPAAFKCVDAKGVTHVGDQIPPACDNVPVIETSRSGSVVRKIEPSLTPDQVKAKNEALAKQREEDKIAAERKRRDLALIATYGNEKDIDLARDRNIDPISGRIKNAHERSLALDKRLAEIEDEMEFYKAGKSKAAKKADKDAKVREVPIQLTSDHERTIAERANLKRTVAALEAEIQDVRKRYAADKARWVELKTNPALRGQVTLPQPASGSALVERNWTKGTAACGEKIVSCKRGESYYCLKADGSWSNVPCEAPKS